MRAGISPSVMYDLKVVLEAALITDRARVLDGTSDLSAVVSRTTVRCMIRNLTGTLLFVIPISPLLIHHSELMLHKTTVLLVHRLADSSPRAVRLIGFPAYGLLSSRSKVVGRHSLNHLSEFIFPVAHFHDSKNEWKK